MPRTQAHRPQRATVIRRITEQVFRIALACSLPWFVAQACGQAAPLSNRIDQAIAAAHLGPQAAIATDTEFVRRVYLDLVGRIPSRAELDSFRATTSEMRRPELIELLLKSDECNQYLAIVFDVMLMERRPDKYLTTVEWRRYLTESFAANKPFNELAAEILSASGEEGANRPAAKFLLEREVEGHAITRDVSRMFLGRDIQCSQCHDHPLVSDYSQAEYYGVLSFLNRTIRFEKTAAENQPVSLIGERAEGDVSYASVFEPGAPKVTALPSLPNGLAFNNEPVLAADQAYLVAPDKDVRPVPRFSRRQQLASLAASGRSELFRRNIANRLWRIMMKQGLVEPPDFMHSDNPPVYPLLLDELADAFALMQYDVKAFLGQIAMSNAYQRSITIPDDLLQGFEQAAQRVRQCQQQMAFQTQVVERSRAALDNSAQQLSSTRTAILNTRQEITSALEERNTLTKETREAVEKQNQASQRLMAQTSVVEALQLATEKAQSVSEQRKDDQPLAAACTLLRERAEAAKNEMTQMEQELATEQTRVKQCEEKLAANDTTLATLRKALEERAVRAEEASGAHRALKANFETEQARVVDLRHQIQLAQQALDFHEAEQTRTAAVSRAQMLADQRDALTTTRDDLTSRQAAQQQTWAAASQACVDAQQRLADADHQWTSHLELLESLRSAAEQVAAARDQLQGDAELAAAHDRLTNRIQSLQQPLADLAAQAQRARAQLDQCERQQAIEAEPLESMTKEFAQRNQQIAELDQQLTSAQAERDQADVQATLAHNRLRDALAGRFVVASIQALSPEQLAASVICALNLGPRFRAEAEAEWQEKNKDKNKDKPSDQVDAQQREQEIVALEQKRRQEVESSFVSLFGATPGSPQDTFFATVDQALFLANDGRLQSWIGPQQDNLAAQLNAQESNEMVADEMYRSILTRDPTDEERVAVVEYLKASPDNRSAAIQEIIWSLLTSVEFRFNH